jgi:hypothetical protein
MLCLRTVEHLGFFVYVHPMPRLRAEVVPESHNGNPSGHPPGPTLADPPGVESGESPMMAVGVVSCLIAALVAAFGMRVAASKQVGVESSHATHW